MRRLLRADPLLQTCTLDCRTYFQSGLWVTALFPTHIRLLILAVASIRGRVGLRPLAIWGYFVVCKLARFAFPAKTSLVYCASQIFPARCITQMERAIMVNSRLLRAFCIAVVQLSFHVYFFFRRRPLRRFVRHGSAVFARLMASRCLSDA